jgi:glycosyltransferase involved in cell wall biosynthesis
MPPRPLISVVIPAKSPGPEFARVLAALRSQREIAPVEICVVDSGCQHDERLVARSYGATIVDVAPEAFSHSESRNVGADRTSGDHLFFTVQDALVPSPTWLRDLSEALERLSVSALTCRETPRGDADLFARVVSFAHWRFLGVGAGETVREAPHNAQPADWRRSAQLSNVACLIQRQAWLDHRFHGDYGEDLDLGLRLLRSGHRLGFVGTPAIVHSHNRPASYHLRRGYVDQRALRRLLPGYAEFASTTSDALGDVRAAYRTVDTLARHQLGATRAPRTLDGLMELTERVVTSPLVDAPSSERWRAHEYVDPLCLDLLTYLSSDPRSTGLEKRSTNTVLSSTLELVRLAVEFLSQTTSALDDYELEDFRRFVYKAWAFQSGVSLAGQHHAALASGI